MAACLTFRPIRGLRQTASVSDIPVVRIWATLVWLCGLVLVLAPPISAKEEAKVRMHTVYRGQRLASIAKRYRVTVDAIRHANDLSGSLIHPGQRLIIPAPDDPKGTKARELHDAGYLEQKGSKPQRSEARERKRESPASRSTPRVHTVGRGQRLGSIAKRYHVTIAAICAANGIKRQDPIHPGQELLIPAPDDKDGSRARAVRNRYLDRASDRNADKAPQRSRSRSWGPYSQAPSKRGYVTLQGYEEAWKGYVIGPGNRVLGGARRAITRVFRAQRVPGGVHPRLVRLLAQVSDQFGGRPIRIVSGYRESSYASESRHKTGRAVDFSIPGVPNSVLCDYLLTLSKVGVGYYPNSSFVHLDVREHKTYWIDYSGPGEPPRYGRIQRLD